MYIDGQEKTPGKSIWEYITNLMDIRHDAQVEKTVSSIKEGIEFKGTNVWILICSIIMASVGLNINAVGVVIGAMLIAPLMGPILGMGMAVGTHDFETLRKSIRAFGVMTAIALITSVVYFLVSPIKAETTEILGRTSPTFLDALVAFFGGVAGIVAASRKEKSNVVPGVAIATALMPPLCTAGYGIATANLPYFMGAGYLFILNSVLIAFATYLGARYLRLPIVHQPDAITEKKYKKRIAFFTTLVLIPSGFILYNVTTESLFNTRAETFISDVVNYEGTEIINQKVMYDDNMIEVFTVGERIPEKTINSWREQLGAYNLKADFLVFQSKDEDIDIKSQLENARVGIVEDLYKKQAEQMKSKDEKIKFLEDELVKVKTNEIPFNQIKKEISLNYPISEVNYSTNDSVMTFFVKWEGKWPKETEKVLSEWLEVRLSKDTVRVVRYE